MSRSEDNFQNLVLRLERCLSGPLRGPNFDSQHTHAGSNQSVTLVPGDLEPDQKEKGKKENIKKCKNLETRVGFVCFFLGARAAAITPV